MKVLMISLHADPTSPAGIGEGGGTHSYIRELLTYFSTKNINILFITRKGNPSLPEYETISENCKIYRIIIKNENPIDKKELFALHNVSLHKVESVLEKLKYQPDLIHSVYWNSGQVAKDLSIKLNIPYIHTVISNGLRRHLAGMQETLEQRFEIEREIFQSSTYIFCITPSERKDLVELYQIDEKKIVIPGRPITKDFFYPAHDDFGRPYHYMVNKSDINKRSQLKLEATHNYNNYTNKWWKKTAFLYCGRIAENKGVDIIVKSWCLLKEKYSDLCPALWIVGGSPQEIEVYKNKFENQYNLESFEENGELIWWGYLDQRGISTLMLKSHALIMHSSYEPGGRVVIEALAAGIPVITTLCGFGVDYIYDWYNGFRVPYGNIYMLCHIMSLFIKQPYLSNSLGINAKNYMQKILEEWDFYNIHQLVYSLAVKNIDKDFHYSGLIDKCNNYNNYINIYPYFNNIISENNLKIQIEKEFQQKVLEIKPISTDDSAVWIVTLESGKYEVWQPYTRMLDSSYVYSSIEQNIDNRDSQYRREQYAAELNINPAFKYIDSHYIYVKNIHQSLNNIKLCNKKVHLAIKNLLHSFCEKNDDNINSILQIFNQNWKNSDIFEIRNIYNKYYEKMPDFLYHSYNINYNLVTQQLYFMLMDNNILISNELSLLYSECEDFLNINIDNATPINGICLEECSLENIIYDEVQNICMFKNAAYLYWGDTSRMLADFVHSYIIYLKINNEKLLPLEEYINMFGTIQDPKLCIGWFFTILFEKLILYQNTLKKEKYEIELEILITYKKLYISDKGLSH